MSSPTRITVVRDLHDDEALVIDEFHRHASHCIRCELSIENKVNDLCQRGHLLAVDVTKYFYTESKVHYSVVDREGGKIMRVKFPREGIEATRLLEAIEGGMELNSRRGRAPAVRSPEVRFGPVSDGPRPIIEYARPRSRTSENISAAQIIERFPGSKPRVTIYQYPRGSLYSNDSRDRSERRYESTRIFRRGDYHK
ncbi:hypothetical protein N7495_004091 [Penicillium taxi]|uniref:uncharacterized protein n=1 Tax=Penicillium taxi TaxID=168475 RepID=UPI0025456617|nr:uncharacterized protein N7495_004091 [Penicillium taxi]KAJ5899347.1 hypothetical protein N7495_004091 [Penicillium taxi]